MESNVTVLDCGHCGNRTPQELKHSETTTGRLFDQNGDFAGSYEEYYFLTKCMTCEAISLYGNWEHTDDPNNLHDATLFYPELRRLSAHVPDSIRSHYEQAKKVLRISPPMFAVAIRIALELLCKDKRALGHVLYEQLEDLARNGLIPATISEIAHTLRSVGNLGAHATAKNITEEEAKVLDELFITIIDYVYVIPARIQQVRDGIANLYKTDGIPKPEASEG